MKKEHDLAKWLSGEMTDEELNAFQNEPEFASYQKIAHYSERLQTNEFDSEAMLKMITSIPKTGSVKMFQKRNWIFRAAAIFFIGLCSWFFFQMTETVSETTISGKKAFCMLPDASEVMLNSDSEMAYKKWNWDENRNLSLKGEAFFKVAKGKTFTVTTQLGNVTVMGTQFNVKSRESRFEVECFEGNVKVEHNGKSVVLQKNQIVVVQNGKFLNATPSNGQKPYWMRNQIRIISMPLYSILAELERIYAIKINVQNLNSNQEFSGLLPADDLATAITIIGETYNLNYKKVSENRIELTAK